MHLIKKLLLLKDISLTFRYDIYKTSNLNLWKIQPSKNQKAFKAFVSKVCSKILLPKSKGLDFDNFAYNMTVSDSKYI